MVSKSNSDLFSSIVINQQGLSNDWEDIKSSAEEKPQELLNLIQTNYYNLDKQKQLICLDLLDYLVEHGNFNLYFAISQKGFISFLITILKLKDSPEQQMKVLGLLEKWGTRFENEKDKVPNFTEVYKSLKTNGVTFPQNFK